MCAGKMKGFTGFTLDVYVHSAPGSSIPLPPMVYLYHSINETFVKKMSVHVQSKTCSKTPLKMALGVTQNGPKWDLCVTQFGVSPEHTLRESFCDKLVPKSDTRATRVCVRDMVYFVQLRERTFVPSPRSYGF